MREATEQQEMLEQWERLDPIFVLGRQRTGTSIMRSALRVAGFLGFIEGHLWFDLVEAFAGFRDQSYMPIVRHDEFALGSRRNLDLEMRFALMVDRFHRDQLPHDLVRWVSKSPGIEAVAAAPMLSELFPRSQFIFMIRNPITTVNSAVAFLTLQSDDSQSSEPDVVPNTCHHWVRVMQTWRKIRHLIRDRYVEIYQEHIVQTPDRVAETVTQFLGVQQCADSVANVFKMRRENTAFPDRDVGDFFCPSELSRVDQVALTRICQEEMALWGYSVNFKQPGPPSLAKAIVIPRDSMDREAYYGWLRSRRVRTLEAQNAELADLIIRVSEGRVMRLLNRLNSMWTRIRYRIGPTL